MLLTAGTVSGRLISMPPISAPSGPRVRRIRASIERYSLFSCAAAREEFDMTTAVRVIALVLATMAMCAQAQPYPFKPMRLLVGYPAGGGMDGIARVFAQKISEDLGQQMVVENRAGASGAIAADAAAKSPPDGYSLYLGESGYLILSTISPNLSTDPMKSFVPVAP